MWRGILIQQLKPDIIAVRMEGGRDLLETKHQTGPTPTVHLKTKEHTFTVILCDKEEKGVGREN